MASGTILRGCISQPRGLFMEDQVIALEVIIVVFVALTITALFALIFTNVNDHTFFIVIALIMLSYILAVWYVGIPQNCNIKINLPDFKVCVE